MRATTRMWQVLEQRRSLDAVLSVRIGAGAAVRVETRWGLGSRSHGRSVESANKRRGGPHSGDGVLWLIH